MESFLIAEFEPCPNAFGLGVSGDIASTGIESGARLATMCCGFLFGWVLGLPPLWIADARHTLAGIELAGNAGQQLRVRVDTVTVQVPGHDVTLPSLPLIGAGAGAGESCDSGVSAAMIESSRTSTADRRSGTVGPDTMPPPWVRR